MKILFATLLVALTSTVGIAEENHAQGRVGRPEDSSSRAAAPSAVTTTESVRCDLLDADPVVHERPLRSYSFFGPLDGKSGLLVLDLGLASPRTISKASLSRRGDRIEICVKDYCLDLTKGKVSGLLVHSGGSEALSCRWFR